MALKDRLLSYYEPVFLMSISLFYLSITALFNPFLLIKSPSTFRSKWFDNFWKVLGPKMATSPMQVNEIESLLSRAHGTVLELGPGAGDQSYHFKPEKIDRMYGAEPNAFLHEELLKKSTQAGLAGKYTVIHAGAQPGSLLVALKNIGLLSGESSSIAPEGIFDSIITVKSLCSAPQKELPETVAVIQALLKPGGEFLFFEHLENNTDALTQAYSWLTDLSWPAVMGGCRLDGKLDLIVNRMGGWATKDLEAAGGYQGYEVFRYVKGVCQKE